jgi:5-methylcytosine-specific restriction enzyme A
MPRIRTIITCKECGQDKPHAAAGMCFPCYKGQKKRRMDGAHSGAVKMDYSAEGRPLCRWCKKEIPYGSKRRTFCSEECVHEWSLRTSPQYVRMKVFARDHGICATCKIDTVKMETELSELMEHDRAAYDAKWVELEAHGWKTHRSSGFWDADHMEAVVDGGGMKGLDNYRTLCIPCHKKETKKLHLRMAQDKRDGKVAHLQVVEAAPLVEVDEAKPVEPVAPPEPTTIEFDQKNPPKPEVIKALEASAFDLIKDLL